MRQKIPVQVNCYSGYTYAERPYSFLWRRKTFKIARVESEWLEPDSKFFKVLTDDEKLFELCYNEGEDKWWLVAMETKEQI